MDMMALDPNKNTNRVKASRANAGLGARGEQGSPCERAYRMYALGRKRSRTAQRAGVHSMCMTDCESEALRRPAERSSFLRHSNSRRCGSVRLAWREGDAGPRC